MCGVAGIPPPLGCIVCHSLPRKTQRALGKILRGKYGTNDAADNPEGKIVGELRHSFGKASGQEI